MKKLLSLMAVLVLGAIVIMAQTTALNVTVPPSVNGAQSSYILYNIPLTAGNTSISATTILSVPATGTYRFSSAGSLTVVGTSCAATSNATVNLIYRDPIAAAGQTITALSTFTTSGTNGTLGTVAETGLPSFTFRALAGSAIQVSTTYSAGSMCSPAPKLQITPIVESLGQ